MREVVDDPSGTGGLEEVVGFGGAQGEDTRAGGSSGADAGGGVFDDDTVGGSKFEQRGAFEIRIGEGFAARDVVAAHEAIGNGKA